MSCFHNENIPLLRYSDFDEKWTSAKLGDIFKFNVAKDMDKNRLSEECNDKFKYPVYGNAIENKGLLGFYDSYEYKPNTITVTARGANTGTAYLRDDYFNAIGRLLVLIPKQEINPRFFIEIINNLNIFIESTGVPQLTAPSLKINKVKYPSIEEQNKIANILYFIDQKIEFMEKKYLIYKDVEKYFLQYMLNTINNNLKAPEIRFNEFINDWTLYKLENLSVVKDGTHDSPKYVEEGYPLITSKNLNDNGIIDFENINYISEEDYDSINKRSKVDKGDILFGMIGTIGNPVIVDKDDFAIKNVALIKEKSNLRNDFLIYYLQSNDILKQFYKFNAGGTQKFIALNLIKNLSIRCPTLKEQDKIQSFLSEINVKINLIEKEIELNKQFKNALLSKMFC